MENYALTSLISITLGGAVGIIATSGKDWSPSVDSSARIEEEMPELNIRIKWRSDDNTLNSCQLPQSDWIGRYLEHQEEDAQSRIAAFSLYRCFRIFLFACLLQNLMLHLFLQWEEGFVKNVSSVMGALMTFSSSTKAWMLVPSTKTKL